MTTKSRILLLSFLLINAMHFSVFVIIPLTASVLYILGQVEGNRAAIIYVAVNFIQKTHLCRWAKVRFFGGDEEKAGCKQPLVHRELLSNVGYKPLSTRLVSRKKLWMPSNVHR